MSNLLNDILALRDSKKDYSPEELAVIKRSLLKRCESVIKGARKPFIDAIDKINDL